MTTTTEQIGEVMAGMFVPPEGGWGSERQLAHRHLIVTGEIRRPTVLEVKAVMPEIAALVGMHVLHEGAAIRSEIPGNVGHTGFVILTTSHLAWHDWDRSDGRSDLQFDLYSCADFEPAKVVTFLRERFDLRHADSKLFSRDYAIVQRWANHTRA